MQIAEPLVIGVLRNSYQGLGAGRRGIVVLVSRMPELGNETDDGTRPPDCDAEGFAPPTSVAVVTPFVIRSVARVNELCPRCETGAPISGR